MFDLMKFDIILLHLQSISKIYKITSKQEWIQILCPYCDDVNRSNKISHGHFYISRYFNFCHCFRCDVKTSLKSFLIKTNFNDRNLLNEIFKTNSTYSYNSEINSKGKVNRNFDISLDMLKKFNAYIDSRILNYDYELFKIYPSYDNYSNTLYCNFNNYYDELSIKRIIYSEKIKNIRYVKTENSKYYFFQNPFHYNTITIAEGPFDILNLYNFSNKFNKSCFFSINGKSYTTGIINIISEFYLCYKNLNINIMSDSDVKLNKFKIKKSLNQIHSNLNIRLFVAAKSKDISDILIFEEIV